MKKFLAVVMAMALSLAFVGCGAEESEAPVEPSEEVSAEAPVEGEEAEVPAEGEAEEVKVMTHEEFMAAEVDSEVTVETYVQAKQGWWTDGETGVSQATFYTQAEDGAYFLYNMACSEEDYAKLTEGAKIRVTGTKAEWAGEVEIVDAKFEILEGNFVAEAFDATELLGTEELIAHQNEKVLFNGLEVEKVEYKNETQGEDIYVTFKSGDASYNFCVESYLTGADTDLYKAVEALKAGDVVDVEGFLYWYEGVNTHITGVTLHA